MPIRVLLVEDEQAISDPLRAALERDRFHVAVAASGAAALSALEDDTPDVVLLDIGLPDIDGRDLCRRIHSSWGLPVIIVSARGEEVDRIVGLELGADDYVIKPFSARELIARINAVMRRLRASPIRSVMRIGEVALDPSARTVTVEGTEVQPTAKEFDLLHLLMRRAGEVVTREEIMDEVWDPHWFGPTKTLDVHVSTLRKKLGSAARYIRTIRGVGFRFATAADLDEMSAAG